MRQLAETVDATTAHPLHTQRRFYCPELDGLRFYAFVGVFVCHTLPVWAGFYAKLHLPRPWLWTAIVRSGGEGVDLFFALSAFLITSLLLKERTETGTISLQRFYARRALRIWPLYFLVVALGVVSAVSMQRVHWYYEQSLPWYYVAGYVFFVSNWTYAVYGAAQSICAPLWTVSIEEQFYLVWPALMKNLRRRGIANAALLTLLLATASQIGVVLLGASRDYIVFGSASRCESFALGILLAAYANRVTMPSKLARCTMVLFGLIGWIVTSRWLSDQEGPASMKMVLGRLVVAFASAAILYGCLHSQTRLLTSGWIVRLGKISYGLYMFHFTGINIVATLMRPTGALQLLVSRSVAFVATVLLAFASYRYVERPFLRWKDRFATVPSRPI